MHGDELPGGTSARQTTDAKDRQAATAQATAMGGSQTNKNTVTNLPIWQREKLLIVKV